MSGRWWPSLHFYAKDSACHITGEWIWMNKQINVEVINKNEPSEKSDVIWIAEVNLSKMAIVIHVLICAFFIHKWTKLWDIFFYIPSSVFLHKFFFFFFAWCPLTLTSSCFFWFLFSVKMFTEHLLCGRYNPSHPWEMKRPLLRGLRAVNRQ